jgi:hypothetical protein
MITMVLQLLLLRIQNVEISKSKELERISCILNSSRPFGRWCISHRKYDNLVEILTRVFDHILPTEAVPSNLVCLHVVIN